MNCPNCNAPINPGVTFCTQCGAQQPQAAPQAAPQPAPQYQQPAPQYQQPAPQYQQPAPQYQQPAPQYQQPAPQYQQGYAPQYQQGYAPQIEKVNMFTPLKKYAQFEGRARRSEYWLFALLNIILSFIPFVNFIAALAFLIPSLAVLVRRLHDTGRSGLFALLLLLPIVGPIILLVFCCIDSQPGANEYGPNPKGM